MPEETIVIDFNDFGKGKKITLDSTTEYVLKFKNYVFEDGDMNYTATQSGNNLVIKFERVGEGYEYSKASYSVSKKAEDGYYNVKETEYYYNQTAKAWALYASEEEKLTADELDDMGLKPGKTTDFYTRNGEDVELKDIKGFPRYDVLQNFGTYTLVNYFKNEVDNVSYQYGDGDKESFAEDEQLTLISYSGTTKGQTIKGSFVDNIIYGSNGNDKIYGVAGSNEIWGNRGDDALYSGTKDDKFNFEIGDAEVVGKSKGDTIYNADRQDSITFYDYEWNPEVGVANVILGKEGNNLVVNHTGYDEFDRVTVNNFFKSPDAYIGQMTINGVSVDAANAAGKDIIQSNKGKLDGTKYNDWFFATGASKITTGEGNDKITTSTGADTITLNGEGTKTINFSKYTGKDTIITTADGVTANLVFDENATLSYAKKGSDMIISAANAATIDPGTSKPIKASVDTITIKDYFNDNADYRPTLQIGGVDAQTVATVDITTADKTPKEWGVLGNKAYIGTEDFDNNFTYTGKGAYTALSYHNTDDTYNLTLTKNSQVLIFDTYGNDELIFNSNVDDLRFVVNIDSNRDIVPLPSDYDMEDPQLDLWMFDKSHLDSVKSVKSLVGTIIQENIPKGFMAIQSYFSRPECKIETFKDANNNNIAIDSWINTVKERVGGWLSDNGYNGYSAMDVMGMAALDKNIDISGLIDAYNISYSETQLPA